MENRPWLDYTGQTTAELIAAKSSHRIDSLLCAFEQGIQLKQQQQHGKRSITAAERLLLAVMALDREVNNGGYSQFFLNSSHGFAPIILDSLRRIGCDATAAITEKALAALRLPAVSARAIAAAMRSRNARRDKLLDRCDQEFYRLREIEPQLFRFVEAHPDQIRLEKTFVAPRRPETAGSSNISKLYVHLKFAPNKDRTLDGVRRLAREVATVRSIPATGDEVEGAAVLYLLNCFLRDGDVAACRTLAPRAFELARQDTLHCVLHCKWVRHLIGASQEELADASTLAYLEYLKGADQSTLMIQNRIKFWVAPLREHPGALSRSVEFFTANFPNVPLQPPVLPATKRSPVRGPRRR